MQLTHTNLKDSFILEPEVFGDHRGYFYEFFNQKTFRELTGLDIGFVQDNLAKSQKGVLRGFHFQKGKYAQAKLVSVFQGAVLDVIIDLRKNSETFGKHFSIVLSAKNKKQLFVPRGFAHAYLCLEDDSLFYYKIDNHYSQENESGIVYDDPTINFNWNFSDEIFLSEKDKKLPYFKDIFNEL